MFFIHSFPGPFSSISTAPPTDALSPPHPPSSSSIKAMCRAPLCRLTPRSCQVWPRPFQVSPFYTSIDTAPLFCRMTFVPPPFKPPAVDHRYVLFSWLFNPLCPWPKAFPQTRTAFSEFLSDSLPQLRAMFVVPFCPNFPFFFTPDPFLQWHFCGKLKFFLPPGSPPRFFRASCL